MAPQTRPRRPAKKSEAVEVRLSHADKQAFLAACERQDRTASGVLREAMAHFVRTGRAAPSRWSRIMPYSLAAASLALLAAVQSADRLPGGDRPYAIAEFDELDLNSDGRLTLPEYRRAQGSVRALADADGSSSQARRRGSVSGLFAAYGAVSPTVLFAQPDQISADCWDAVELEMAAQDARHFNRIDADGDGVVTAEEWGAYQLNTARRGFDAMEQTGDGFLTLEDFRQRHAQMEEFMRAEPERIERVMDPETFNEDTPDAVRLCAPEFVRLAQSAQPAEPQRREYLDMSAEEHFEDMVEWARPEDPDRITFEDYARAQERGRD
ncbi:hypothetical protein FKB34_00540 [Glycocaulis profundi]|nr:hypothetical protein FKB34_00540 [Glycocaulis profundi]